MNNNSQQLVLKDFHGVPEITETAYELRRHALRLAQAIRNVETSDQQVAAIDALRALKEIRTGMEQTRKSVKAPVLALGKKIDNLASGFMTDVESQYGRLSGLINHYQRKQLAKQHEETTKIEQQQATAAQLREQAEKARAAGDLARATYLEQEALDAEMNAELAVVSAGDKPKGLVVKQSINFQVIDPIVFCQAYPQFWKWNEENEHLKLDRLSVREELNKENGLFRRTRFPEELSQTEDQRLVQPAGLRVFEETKSHLR